MRDWLLVLILFAGLGSSFSFAQNNEPTNPLDWYLTELRANRPEPALVRFAKECGVDMKTARTRYAQMPYHKWKAVENLSNARNDQEIDLYSTVAVSSNRNRILVEQWDMDSESASESRLLICLEGQRIRLIEEIDWALPDESEPNVKPVWLGYEQRWKASKDGKYSTVLLRYVNDREQLVPALKPGSGVPLASNVFPKVNDWDDLKLPAELLQ